MTSLEIAELTGKQHKHLMEAIRKMEPAWEKVHGSKFRLMFREVKIGNGAVRRDPYYVLTKTKCLYIATKFNDEARAKLLDISDLNKEDFDELLIEQKAHTYWIHFAVKPSCNRRRTNLSKG